MKETSYFPVVISDQKLRPIYIKESWPRQVFILGKWYIRNASLVW